ncbi:hypothetical protein MICRO8M_80197 [Microbacterium sp. 8M]|nr:hypothetical protein MICRO8M_80197 [Microbacterium sp. 8M]
MSVMDAARRDDPVLVQAKGPRYHPALRSGPVLRQAQQPLDRNTTLTAAVTGLPRSVLLTSAVDRGVLPRAPR